MYSLPPPGAKPLTFSFRCENLFVALSVGADFIILYYTGKLIGLSKRELLCSYHIASGAFKLQRY